MMLPPFPAYKNYLAAALAICFVSILTCIGAAAPESPVEGNIARKTDEVKNWRFEQHEDAKGTISVESGAIVFDVTKDDGTDWHVQAFQTPLDLKDGTEYIVTFKAKSEGVRPARLQAGIDEDDWHNVGLDEEITLGREWKDYDYKFTANDTRPMKNRIGFVLGMEKGKVYVKDLVLKPAKK